jgi:hypothetical protein
MGYQRHRGQNDTLPTRRIWITEPSLVLNDSFGIFNFYDGTLSKFTSSSEKDSVEKSQRMDRCKQQGKGNDKPEGGNFAAAAAATTLVGLYRT